MRSDQSPEYNLVFALRAQRDIDEILQYTLAEWGEIQAEKYKGTLDQGFRAIMSHPGIGHSRRDLPSNYSAFQAGQHVIVFRVEDKTVYVVRVLHGSMDFSGKI